MAASGENLRNIKAKIPVVKTLMQKKQCLANKSKLNDGLHLIYP
jgi:hypothetical protein